MKLLGGADEVKPKHCVECKEMKAHYWNENLCMDCYKKLLREKVEND